ncbi:hypothetical protein LSH36_207g07036 [Paralvinella palmiformis]|uniref:Uncharacterized protein n=1 Tax=Paralvinella palmiformis TaxID=53620 RepID=A0AAD9JR97_9ANNE|nr:hypothetical protein LSH36_207g07036 [Paralvinella palmiformis]
MEPTGGDVDVDQTYAYMNQSQLYDLRSSHDVMNGGRENGQSGLANGNGVTQRPDLINDGTFNNDGANNGQVNNGQAGPMAVASAAAPVVAGAATPRKTYTQEEIDAINQKYKPKKTWARRKKTIPRDPEFVFADDKVATRIQRLANRLRNRLSSVRWSSGDKQNDGETAQPTPEQGIDAETVDPVRSGELPKAQKIKGPPIRYQMPRGFAPASHCTPQHIKGT